MWTGSDLPEYFNCMTVLFRSNLDFNQGFSYLSEVGARGLLIWAKRHLGKFDAV